MVAGADGITVLCSANPTGEAEQTWLLRLNHDGNVIWERRYDPSLGAGRAMAVPPDGGFVIAGEVRGSDLEYQGQLTRLDDAGRVIAKSSFGPRGATGFNAVTITHDGSVVMGGTAHRKGWLVRATNARRAHWELLIDDVDEVVALAAVPENGFAMAARQEWSTTVLGRTRLALFTVDGRLRWQKKLPTAGRAEPGGLAVCAEGGLVAVGHHVAGEQGAAQLWVVRLDQARDVAWERQLGFTDDNLRGRAIAPLPGGGVVVAADAQTADGREVRMVCLAADGTLRWERAFSGGQKYELARGLAHTSDDGLVLVGTTTEPSQDKAGAWILQLDNEGRRRWERVFYSAA